MDAEAEREFRNAYPSGDAPVQHLNTSSKILHYRADQTTENDFIRRVTTYAPWNADGEITDASGFSSRISSA